MEQSELLQKRCLIKDNSKYAVVCIHEVKILEFSPSGNWMKLMNLQGNKYWKSVREIDIIEVLSDKKIF